jgi:hypothetical protein
VPLFGATLIGSGTNSDREIGILRRVQKETVEQIVELTLDQTVAWITCNQRLHTGKGVSMSAKEEPIDPSSKCNQCNKEISHAEAMTPEGQEYAQFFCGLGCYQQWLRRNDGSQDEVDQPA